MEFPKNSHFDRGEHESAFEYMSRIADGEPTDREGNFIKTTSVYVSALEEWIADLEDIELATEDWGIEDAVRRVADSIRSHLPG